MGAGRLILIGSASLMMALAIQAVMGFAFDLSTFGIIHGFAVAIAIFAARHDSIRYAVAAFIF
jgi:hypothetical protein